MLREPRREDQTACTAVAPDAVFTVRTYGTGQLYGHPRCADPHPELSEPAFWQRSVRGGEGRVVIGIDEVDKIRDSDRAEAFLNDVKAIFGVPGCLYLVSLSEDAMAGCWQVACQGTSSASCGHSST
jgi:hypothetical protein